MRSFSEFFPWGHTLGWSLINSLWQALIVLGVVIFLLRWIPSKFSQLRYGIACAGLAITILGSIFTSVYLNQTTNEQRQFELSSFAAQKAVMEKETISGATTFSLREIPQKVQTALQPYMATILFGWCLGAMLFMLRMVSGWWYISRLQSEATLMTGEWNNRLQSLARQLNINRVVLLAQSARIHAPLVIGFLKPIVLVPAGMMAGLSTEQIETIFIHELAHIRRHDYIINLIQSFVEALFFFNPFVWILSGIIRREREYCCDDAVLTKGSPLAYAHALARLEEERLSKAMFALALAENKNQLLYRIKRIMEKSAKNYSGKDRLVPALLLVVGLICASWLTIRTENGSMFRREETSLIPQDTTIKKTDNLKRSRTTIITFDETGEPHEEVIEEFEGDGDFDLEIPPIAFDVDVPAFPSFPSMPGVPAMAAVPPIPAFPDVNFYMPAIPGVPGVEPFEFSLYTFNFDTIPGAFHFRGGNNWEEFSAAFEEKFREQFSDFYKAHEKDFEEMMEEMEKNFAERFDDDGLHALQEQAWANAALADEERVQANLHQLQQHPRAELWEDQVEHVREAHKEMQELQENRNEEMAETLHRQARELSENMKEREREMRDAEREMKTFQKELKEQLVKDGYLGKQEEIESINWDDDGEIEINNKKIKEIDRSKYNDLHRKYFKSGRYRFRELKD